MTSLERERLTSSSNLKALLTQPIGENSQTHLQSLVSALNEHATVAITDHEGTILYVNDKFCSISGYSREELLGNNPRILNSGHHSKAFFQELWSTIKSGKSWHGEIQNRTKNNDFYWVKTTIMPVPSEQPSKSNFVAILTDISAQQRLEKELLEVSEREQVRLGSELHDSLAQDLVAIGLQSRILQDSLQRLGLEKESQEAHTLTQGISDAIRKVRDFSRGLSQLKLHEDGFCLSLRQFCESLSEIYGIPCDFTCHSAIEPSDSSVSNHLFRIAQEALRNAARHSGGNHILISLSQEEHSWILDTSDNGNGICDSDFKKGIGLSIMRYRANLLGGRLVITGKRQKGTRVVCEIPVR